MPDQPPLSRARFDAPKRRSKDPLDTKRDRTGWLNVLAAAVTMGLVGLSLTGGSTYRAMSGSAWVGLLVYVICFGPSLGVVGPLASVGVAVIAPLPIAVWFAARVCVVLSDDGSVVIRNFRTHPVPLVSFAVVMQTGPQGAKQVNFIDERGKATPAFAMTLWGGGGRAAAQSGRALGDWVARCEVNGVTVSLDESDQRREAARLERVQRGLGQSQPDPVEAMRSMRRAAIGDELVSVRSVDGGFVVSVESLASSGATETEVYPTLEAAVDRGVEEVMRRHKIADSFRRGGVSPRARHDDGA